jgi:hypothetical protein
MLQNPEESAPTLADRRAEANGYLLRMMFARMDAVAMAVAMGVICAVCLFLATAVLLLKGAPPGVAVGGNLAALGIFLPGYEISWRGVVVGSLYGLAIGSVAGYLLSVFWNFMHVIFIGLAVLRGNWLD